MSQEEIIEKVYKAFNDRDIDAVLFYFHPEVEWPNGWKGGYVYGHEQVRDYWTRQWKELNPVVIPLESRIMDTGQLEVKVSQLVKDLSGEILHDGLVYHRYKFENNLIRRMDIH